MADNYENYGLTFLLEDDEVYKGFVGYLISEGKAIKGYYGKTYYYKSLGGVEFWVRTDIGEDGALIVNGVDVHSGGFEAWNLIVGDFELAPKEDSKLARVIMFKGTKDQAGLLPVQIITADVLPSFVAGDEIKAQIIAQPLDIEYFADEEAYVAAQPKDKNGEKWTTASGTLFPIAFLNNHSPEKYEEGKYYESDSYLTFHATVKKLYYGTIGKGEEESRTFLRCVVDTVYGELEFDHTYEQVPEEQRKNIKVGSVISGVCILSGDSAIYEYEDGAIKDFDHDLRLLRHVFVTGEADRLYSVFNKLPLYESDLSKKTICGAEKIINWIKHVHEIGKEKCFAQLAKLTESDDPFNYPIGTKCLALSYGEKDHYEALVFIHVNKDGLIETIEIRKDPSFRFELEAPVEPPLDEDIEIPLELSKYMISRAVFLKMIDQSFEDSLNEKNSNDALYEEHAQAVYDALQKVPEEERTESAENVFGYLFAKSMELAIAEREEGAVSNPATEFRIKEALAGQINTNCSQEKRQKLEKALFLGKQFNNDLTFFAKWVKLDKALDEALFIEGAVLVQRIGEAASEKFIHS